MGIENMSKKRMTCVAVILAIAVVLVIAYVFSGGDDEPKAEAIATSEPVGEQPPVQVYPERGDKVAIKSKQGRYLCTYYDGIDTDQVMLPDSGGTASYNGTLISTKYTAKAVTVNIDGPSHFVSGWVTASDGGVAAFTVPDGESTSGILLDMNDFDAYVSGIADITLCSKG